MADGKTVRLTETTGYPFDETVRLTLATDDDVAFPLYLRVPGWAEGSSVTVNGTDFDVTNAAGKYIRIDRKWSNGDMVELKLPMAVATKVWDQNNGSVSVNYGPLTLSLKIDEIYEQHDSRDKEFVQDDSHWQQGVDASLWPCYVIKPGSAWNYALMVDNNNQPLNFSVTKKEWPADNMPFTLDSVPFEFSATGVKIPSWGYDSTGMTDVLPSPAALTISTSTETTPTSLTLVPMGAARLRISAFPLLSSLLDN